MEDEHCHTEGSKVPFTTRNYGVTTCAYNEWQIAVNYNKSLADMSCGKRRIPKIEELLELPLVKFADLWREEVIAVVLYTGPMYEQYNCILRQWPKNVYNDMVKQGSMFTTTIYALVSAVQKLASAIKMPDGLKLYRGLGGVRDLPDSFFKAHQNGGRGFTEWGFMSTTSEKHVAVYYLAKDSQKQVSLPMVLELTVSAVDRGACIKELSQYPGELEYLWVPCSFVAPGGPERMEVTEHHGVVRIVPVRVNSNLTAHTLEQIVSTKKQTHVAAFKYAIQEVERDLSHMASKEWWCDYLLQPILSECKEVLKRHGNIEAKEYAKDDVFQQLVTEMLDVKTMAKSKMRLGLDDPSQKPFVLSGVPLNEAHQQLIHFLSHRLSNNEDASARMAAAMDVCKLKGLFSRHFDTSVEDRIVSAAAEGVSSRDLELLIEASGLKNPAHSREKPRLAEAMAKAVEFGHVHCVQELLKARADINSAGITGYTPLCKAAASGRLEVVRTLMAARADVNAADKQGNTPLCRAATGGHLEVVSVLLEAKADVDSADKDGYPRLFKAASGGYTDVTRMLVQAKADVNSDEHACLPLCAAAEGGHSEVVRTLIEAKADINNADNHGYTALCGAAAVGHSEVTRILIKANADVNIADEHGNTALSKAAAGGHLEVLRMLIEAEANINASDEDGYPPLYKAAEGGYLQLVRMLIEVKADVNIVDKHGYTPLYKAAAHGQVQAVRTLIEVEADVNVADDHGYTALCGAAAVGHSEVTRILVEAKADVNAADIDGYTPLCGAAAYGHSEVLRMLLEAKADVNATTKSGETPLWAAARSTVCYQRLLEAGADIKVRDNTGQSLLMWAVSRQSWDLASILVSQGGYQMLAAEDSFGWTCLDMIPACCNHEESPREWIKSVQATDEQCADFIQKLDKRATGVEGLCNDKWDIERLRGDEWDVFMKADKGTCVVCFNGFVTVGASNYICVSGSAGYYELHVLRMGEALQWGFCSEAFEQCDEYSGDGLGDDQFSWGIDGHRLLKWHRGSSEFGGRQWQEGDVIGLACDLRLGSEAQLCKQHKGSDRVDGGEMGHCGGSIWVSLNGDFSPPYGLVFCLDEGITGLFAAFTSRNGIVRCNLGQEPFKHAPPGEGFKPMCSFRRS
jgi:ankyrin repeat protein